MNALNLHQAHQRLGATFSEVEGWEVAAHYGHPPRETEWLWTTAGVLDLSFRTRLCVLGADRDRFLNGQVTNNLKTLRIGDGCYAALLTPKGKMQADANLFRLPQEWLLDAEPGLGTTLAQRFEKYKVADDVQVVDAAGAYGLLSVQGPRAPEVVGGVEWGFAPPARPFAFSTGQHPTWGELYLMNQPRLGAAGFDLFAPTEALEGLLGALLRAAANAGGGLCGWQALETARIEAGIPRFGADLDERNLPPEAGLEARAISYSKGCYVGQETISRLRTYGQVAKRLCGLRLESDLSALPARGDPLLAGGRVVGYMTSAAQSAALGAPLALGYIQRQYARAGSDLALRTSLGETQVRVAELPFRRAQA